MGILRRSVNLHEQTFRPEVRLKTRIEETEERKLIEAAQRESGASENYPKATSAVCVRMSRGASGTMPRKTSLGKSSTRHSLRVPPSLSR
jgi:hypothetical protein